MGYVYELLHVLQTIKDDQKAGGTPENVKHFIKMAQHSSLLIDSKRKVDSEK